MDTVGIGSHNGDSVVSSTSLLARDEQGPVIAVNKGSTSPFLLLGDHAGRQIPAKLEQLGLPPAELDRHIAWDIGVHLLGLALSARLGCAFIAQRYSRLVIDCNRDPASADSVAQVSDGTTIPGNLGLSAAARQQRLDEIFAPYHAAIGRELDHRAKQGLPTRLIALHSFTPVFAGLSRAWMYGVLHMGDSPFCQGVLAKLREMHGPDLVGDNQPYSMDGTDFTVPHHASRRGLDYLELEVRQDLLADEDGIEAVAGEVLRALGG
jgi:predicted N-formylglutamate amidohydrolase